MRVSEGRTLTAASPVELQRCHLCCAAVVHGSRKLPPVRQFSQGLRPAKMVPAAALREEMQERGASRLTEADYTIAASPLNGAAISKSFFWPVQCAQLVKVPLDSVEFASCVTAILRSSWNGRGYSPIQNGFLPWTARWSVHCSEHPPIMSWTAS